MVFVGKINNYLWWVLKPDRPDWKLMMMMLMAQPPMKFSFAGCIVCCFANTSGHHQQNIPIGIQRFDKVRVNNKNFDKVKNLHVNWYSAAIKALLGQLGKDLYGKLGKNEKKALSACLNRIDDKRDLVESARCLVKTRKQYLMLKREEIIDEIINAQRQNEDGWIGGFRTRRSAARHERMPNNNDLAMNNLRLAHKLISDQPARRNKFQLSKISQNTEKWTVKQASKMPILQSSVEKSPVARVANIVSSFTSFQPTTEKTKLQMWPVVVAGSSGRPCTTHFST
uniref:Uncharacterized protein n=1 Tax=Ditylenchus dipsaci TaxID=166011 RepID=A0A915CUM8_9BILA